MNETILKEIEKANNVLFQFSGGKDSQLALEYTLPTIKELDKEYKACFVDTGAEFPSVLFHVINYTKKNRIPLKIIHSNNIVEDFYNNGVFPHPIYQDCKHRFINEPFNKYALKNKSLIIAGGRNNQRHGNTKNQMIKTLKDGKLCLLNPLYDVDKRTYQKMVSETELWCGYKKGFVRTACWCCPFQKKEQWKAMKIHCPELWSQMKNLVERLEVIALTDRKGRGTCFSRIRQYWKNQYDVDLNVNYSVIPEQRRLSI